MYNQVVCAAMRGPNSPETREGQQIGEGGAIENEGPQECGGGGEVSEAFQPNKPRQGGKHREIRRNIRI